MDLKLSYLHRLLPFVIAAEMNCSPRVEKLNSRHLKQKAHVIRVEYLELQDVVVKVEADGVGVTQVDFQACLAGIHYEDHLQTSCWHTRRKDAVAKTNVKMAIGRPGN